MIELGFVIIKWLRSGITLINVRQKILIAYVWMSLSGVPFEIPFRFMCVRCYTFFAFSFPYFCFLCWDFFSLSLSNHFRIVLILMSFISYIFMFMYISLFIIITHFGQLHHHSSKTFGDAIAFILSCSYTFFICNNVTYS